MHGLGELRPLGNVSFMDRTFWRVLLNSLQRDTFLDALPQRRHLFPLMLRPEWKIELIDYKKVKLPTEIKFYISLNPYYIAINLRISLHLVSFPSLQSTQSHATIHHHNRRDREISNQYVVQDCQSWCDWQVLSFHWYHGPAKHIHSLYHRVGYS